MILMAFFKEYPENFTNISFHITRQCICGNYNWQLLADRLCNYFFISLHLSRKITFHYGRYFTAMLEVCKMETLSLYFRLYEKSIRYFFKFFNVHKTFCSPRGTMGTDLIAHSIHKMISSIQRTVPPLQKNCTTMLIQFTKKLQNFTVWNQKFACQ